MNIHKITIYLEKKKTKNIFWNNVFKLKLGLNKLRWKIKGENYRCMLLEPYETLYFHITKVACTSMRNFFFELINGREAKDEFELDRFPSVKKRNYDNYYPYFKFAFVRNPYDRVVSCYLNQINNKHNFERDIFSDSHPDFRQDMTFKEFVELISTIPDEEANIHFRSQHTVIVDDGKILPDFIGKFENLQEDFNFICKRLGISKSLKLKHRNKSIREGYLTYYDKYTWDLVTKRFRDDLELFGYDMEWRI